MRNNRGIVYSSLLHGIILFFLLVGLPDFFHREVDMEPESVSVDILPIAPMSNVKPHEKQPEPEKKLPEEDKSVQKKSTPESAPEESQPQEQDQVPLPAKKIPKKPEKKKPEKEKPKKPKDDLSSILESVKNQAKTEEGKKPSQEKQNSDKQAKSTNYDASQPLSMSEKDAIRSQIEQCWNAPVGAKDAQNLVVTLHITLNQDGSLIKDELIAEQQGRYASDPFFRAAADAATRAIERCSPLKNLAPDKYGTWGDMELDFNPHDMLQ